MKHSTSKQGSIIAPMILPAAVVLVLYGMWIGLRSLPGQAEVAQAEQELASLQGSKTTPQQVAALKQQVAETEAKLEQARQQLAAGQLRAGQFSGQTVADADQLQELGTLDQVFRNQGMHIVSDRMLTQRGTTQLASSLDDASRQLLNEIQASRESTDEKGKKVPYLPPKRPSDVGSEEYLAALNQSVGRARTPRMQMREVEVVGTYGNMLAALDDLNECCGNSVVVGVAVKRPDSRAVASNLRLWTLQLQVRPMPINDMPPLESPELQLASDTK